MDKNADGPVLVIEDSDPDWEALQWSFGKIGFEHPVERCTDGDDALEYLSRASPLPSLVLLDLNLLTLDGHEVLQAIKDDPRLREIPVVVWTTSSNPDDVHGCYLRGANTYLRKPVTSENLLRAMRSLIDYWYRVAVLPDPERRR